MSEMRVVEGHFKVNDDTVKLLEEMLEIAKSGFIQGVGISFYSADTGIGHRVSSCDNQVMMYAATQQMAFCMNEELLVPLDDEPTGA